MRVALLVAGWLAAGGMWPWDEGSAIAWRSSGPGGGGWIPAIAADPLRPNVLHVGCDVGGYYFSSNRGGSYQIRNFGLCDYYVQDIAVHPRNPNIIILGTLAGIHKTTDAGRHWRWIRKGFPEIQRYSYSAPVSCVVFDPSNPDTVYAGVGYPRKGLGGHGWIYKSEDCGESWRLVSAGQLPDDAIIWDLAINPRHPQTLLAATQHGIFRSGDAGRTWRDSSSGLPHRYVQRIAFAPSNPNVVYCTLRTMARDGKPWDGFICRSDDGGRTWRPCGTEGLSMRVGRSDQPHQMTSNYREIVVDPRDENVIYVGSTAWVSPGVYKSTDGGRTWRWVSVHHGEDKNMELGWIDFWGPTVQCLTISPREPDTLYFGASGHVFMTRDAGRTWQQRYCRTFPDGRFSGTGLEVTCMFDIVPDPHRRGRIYYCFYDVGLLISDDGGRTFRRSYEGMKYRGNCFTVLPDPDVAGRLWACTGWWARNAGDVCLSEDGGRTWKVVGKPETGLPDGQTRILRLDPSSPRSARRLLVTCNGHGTYESCDGGMTWRCINGNLPPEAAKRPRGLLLDPRNPRHIIAALGGTPSRGSGIYESLDGGRTWRRINREPEFADIQDLAADPRNFSTLYLCQREMYDRTANPPVVRPGGLFKSTDGGRTWRRIYDFHFCRRIYVSPHNSRELYLLTTDHPYHDNSLAPGLLRSTDGGRTWRPENRGLSLLRVACLAFDPFDRRRLYLGTGGNGPFIGTILP